MKKVYLVSRTPRKYELLSYVSELESIGYKIQARWLLENHGRSLKEWSSDQERWKVFAKDDFDDIKTSDLVICFTEVPLNVEASKSHGARHVEMGIALGLDKTVVVVGPEENVFCCHPKVVKVESWDKCKEFLKNF